MSIQDAAQAQTDEEEETNDGDINSLEDVYKAVTGDEDGVITHEQKQGPSHDPVDDETETIESDVTEAIKSDGLDEAVERQNTSGGSTD